MSVNVCVFRYDNNNREAVRYNNRSVTPPISWTSMGYQITIEARVFESIPPDTTNVGSTRTYELPKPQRTITGGTEYFAKFLLETGYEVLASKNVSSTAVSVYVAVGADQSSTQQSIFLSGETAYYHAIPSATYRFLEWRNGETFISSSNPLSRTITADLTLTAIFEKYKWAIQSKSNNTTVGNAYVGTSGIQIGYYALNNESVTLRASVKTAYRPGTNNSVYKFKRWTLNGVEVGTGYSLFAKVDGIDFPMEGSITITAGQADRDYYAEFIPVKYTLNVTPQNTDHGTVEVYVAGIKTLTDVGISVAGTNGVEVRSTPAFGYYITGWWDGTTLLPYTTSYPFTMPDANLSLEARYAVLPDALLVVTKKKGSGDDDPEDMGSVALYHTVDNYVSTSPVGELTLQGSMFTTKQYRLIPAPASSLFQFDGWYKTVEGSDVLITDDTVFNVDGTSLYIDVLDETQINVIARFSTRVLCTIDPVASDSSVYTSGNAAKAAGCTCVVNTLPPDYDADSDGLHDSGDKWLSGQTITVEARQAIGWELRNWIVKKAVSPFTTLYSRAKGDVGFGQTFAFTLLENVQVVAVSSYTLPANQVQIQALLKSGQPLTSGTVEIHPCGDNYVEAENGSTANVDDGCECELTAIPANGYRFVGWRVATEGSSVISANPVYSFTVSGNAVYYAEFEESDGEALKLFEGSDSNMTLRWASKTFLAPVPISMSSARVYADAYPVRIGVGMADNPSHPAATANVLYTTAQNQNPFRLPMRRPRKSIVIEIEATDVVSEVSVATSMEDLKNA